VVAAFTSADVAFEDLAAIAVAARDGLAIENNGIDGVVGGGREA